MNQKECFSFHRHALIRRLTISSEDLGSLFPTPSTIMKKAKSRMMDKDGRSRNRLSHTSAPLYFAKSKRPAPTDLDGVGAPNRLPGGQQGQQQQQQQALSRRQRSLQAKGKSSNAAPAWHFHGTTYEVTYANTKPFCLTEANKAYLRTVGRNVGSQGAAFHSPAGGRSAPSLTSLHIVETNQEIPVKGCVTPESCRYTRRKKKIKES